MAQNTETPWQGGRVHGPATLLQAQHPHAPLGVHSNPAEAGIDARRLATLAAKIAGNPVARFVGTLYGTCPYCAHPTVLIPGLWVHTHNGIAMCQPDDLIHSADIESGRERCASDARTAHPYVAPGEFYMLGEFKLTAESLDAGCARSCVIAKAYDADPDTDLDQFRGM